MTFNVKTNINKDISTIIRKGDTIKLIESFDEDKFCIRTGFVQTVPKQYKNLEHVYEAKVYDRIKNGLLTKFEEHEVKVDWYLCNNSNPAQSLAHYLAEKAGFIIGEMMFEDVINPTTGLHIKVKYAPFEKGKRVMAEFSELISSVRGKLAMDPEDRLFLTCPFNGADYDDIDYVFADNESIFQSLDTKLIEAEYDRVKVTYDSFNILERQVCWMYYAKDSYDEINDEANMLLTSATTSAWIKKQWITPIAINLESGTPEIVVEDAAGNDMSAFFNYEIDANMTGGKVRFHNLSPDTNIYIQKFKIYGQPLEKMPGNETSYTEVADPQKTLPIENKYIQSSELAELNAKYSFHMECKDRTAYSFTGAFTPFILASNVATINLRDIGNQKVIINRYIHQTKKNRPVTKFDMIEYLPFPALFDGNLETVRASENIANDSSDFERKKLEGTGVYSEGLPVPQPQNIVTIGSFRRIWIEWDEVNRADLQGYNLYISDVTDPVNPVTRKYFAQSNGYSFEAPNGHSFEIQVSTKCIAGESEKAGIVQASTQLLETADYQDLSIVNAKIADLVADKITAGTLNAMLVAIANDQVTIDASGITILGKKKLTLKATDQEGYIKIEDDNGNYTILDAEHLKFYHAGDVDPHWYSRRVIYGVAESGDYINLETQTGVPWDHPPKVQTAISSLQTFYPSQAGSDIYHECYASDITAQGFRVHGSSFAPVGSPQTILHSDYNVNDDSHFFDGEESIVATLTQANTTKINVNLKIRGVYTFIGAGQFSYNYRLRLDVMYRVSGGSWINHGYINLAGYVFSPKNTSGDNIVTHGIEANITAWHNSYIEQGNVLYIAIEGGKDG